MSTKVGGKVGESVGKAGAALSVVVFAGVSLFAKAVFGRRKKREELPKVLRNAPVDDEPETDEERAAVAEALDALQRGELITDDELARKLSL